MAVTDTDTTQADFAEGNLTDVEADSGDYLRLADTDVLSFDGTDDSVEIGDSSDFDLNDTDFTLSAWVKISYNKDQTFVTKWSDSECWKWRINEDSNDNWVQTLEINYGGTNEKVAHSSTEPTDGNFHFCTLVWDYSEQKAIFYIDGNYDGEGNSGGVWGTNTGPAEIGAASGKQFMDGIISDVRVWNYARTQTEIQDNMNKRLNGDEPGLVAYYPLDEGTGTTATDSAGSNDGSINGATWQANETLYFMNSDEDNNRVSPQLDLSAASTVSSSDISWTETLNSQTITIETRVSTDGGSTWDSWQTCTNGDPIPNLSEGDDVSNGLLECRQNLTTADITATPQLDTLDLTVYGGYVISGTVTDGDTAVENAEVAVISADDDQLTNATILDVKQTDASGNWSAVIVEGKIGFAASFHKDASDNYYRAPGHGYLSEGA